MSNDVETKASATPRGKSGHHAPKPRPPASESSPGETEKPAKSGSRRPSFAALLVEAGVASQEDVKAASAEGLVTGEKLGEVVVRKGWATEEVVAEVLAKQWELPYANADELMVDEQAASLIPLETARELQVLPVGFEGTAVVFAVAEPTSARFKEVEERYGEASYIVVARSALLSVLDDSPRVVEEPETPEAAAEGRERDAETIRTLEAKVDEQAEVLASLGEQVASWNARLNTAATS